MKLIGAGLFLAATACVLGLPQAADAAVVSGVVTGTINNWNSGVDSGGYFSGQANTSLLGQQMTIHYEYSTSGTGITYTHDNDSSLITFTNAAAGSFTMSWTVGAVTFSRDLSDGGTIDADHNGSPLRVDMGWYPNGNNPAGFIQQNNITSSQAYFDGVLTQPLTGALSNWSVYLGFPGYPNSTWIALSDVTASVAATEVPEPATMAALLSGLAGLGGIRLRRRRNLSGKLTVACGSATAEPATA